MKATNLLHLLSFLILLVASKESTYANTIIEVSVDATDSLALVALYYSTDGDNWTDHSNWLTGPVNTWYGIISDGQYVTEIKLNSNGLKGPIPPEIGDLSNLQSLNLSNNDLIDSIPPEFGALKNLQVLLINSTQLTGQIPFQLGELTNLHDVRLFHNQFTGPIPASLANLTNLQYLSLGGNELTGTIPAELGNLTNLQHLSLAGNQLTGPIPPEIGNLVDLRELHLYDNELSGTIPHEIGSLINLTWLNLFMNQLTGPLPLELGNLTSLERVMLFDNQLTDSIPPELGRLQNLEEIYLNNNQLIGPIPSEIAALNKLDDLVLNNNQLTGTIPPELGRLAYLRFLELDNNQLTGEIPIELCNLVNLVFLTLDNNLLTGSIPMDIGNLNKLIRLELSNNQFSGGIPDGICTMGNLEKLDLGNNQLSGNVPVNLGNLVKLTHLSLDHNMLTGLTDMSGMNDLDSLWVNNNRLTFGDLQNTGLDFSAIPYVKYSPQYEITDPCQSGADSYISLTNSTDGTGNTYQWFRDGLPLDGETSAQLVVYDQLEGDYSCEVYNAQFPELILSTGIFALDTNATHGIKRDDYDALAALYQSTNGENWLQNTNWLSEELVETWYGITVECGHVTGISLDDNNLNGQLTSEIGDLENLEVLSLMNNQLSGPLVPELGKLFNLKELYLFQNHFSGNIPATLGNLNNLETLIINRNTLTDSLPAGIGNLPHLEILSISDNRLTMLPDLSGLDQLIGIYLFNNRFTFEDLEQSNLDAVSVSFSKKYAPQDTLSLVATQMGVEDSSTVVIDCNALTVEDLWSTNNEFSLFKENDTIFDWSSNSLFIIPDFSNSDEGNYTIRVRNSIFPELILYSDTLQVYINNLIDSEITSEDILRVNIFPNPTKGLIHISSSHPVNKIRTFDINGRLIEELNYIGFGGTVDLSHYSKGTYIFQISIEKSAYFEKVLVE